MEQNHKIDEIHDLLTNQLSEDHDLLVRTNQLISLHVEECKNRKEHQNKIEADQENRIRYVERLLYIGLGALGLIQGWHTLFSGGK